MKAGRSGRTTAAPIPGPPQAIAFVLEPGKSGVARPGVFPTVLAEEATACDPWQTHAFRFRADKYEVLERVLPNLGVPPASFS